MWGGLVKIGPRTGVLTQYSSQVRKFQSAVNTGIELLREVRFPVKIQPEEVQEALDTRDVVFFSDKYKGSPCLPLLRLLLSSGVDPSGSNTANVLETYYHILQKVPPLLELQIVSDVHTEFVKCLDPILENLKLWKKSDRAAPYLALLVLSHLFLLSHP